MEKWSRRGLLLCLTAAVLTGCGGEEAGQVRLEDMRQDLETSDALADAEQAGGSQKTDDTRQQERGEADSAGQGAENPEGVEKGSAGPAGVGQKETEAPGSTSGQNGQTSREETGKTGEVQDGRLEDLAQEPDPDREARCQAYIAVLEDIYFDQKFPGGQDLGYQPGANHDVADNMFTVYDIDFDGNDELIVCYTTTYMGGMSELIYDYDSATGDVREEVRLFPALTYYDNGIIEEQASHNHGMASDMSTDGAFWPYALYRYDPQQDAYTLFVDVDAWSLGYREEDYDGNPFPADVDVDGDGLVYYVMTGGRYERKDPMDGAEYQQWRDSCLEGAGTVQVPYKSLIPDNIYAIK